MKKLIYLSLSILEFSKTLMYQFWYNCIKTKYQNNANLCHKDTDSFILHIKTKDVYRDIANNLAKKDLTHQNTGLKDHCHWVNEKWIRWKDYDINSGLDQKHILI